jgi:PDDEXK-like uncharacterized protein DUF3799
MTALMPVTPLIPAPKPGVYQNIPAAVYHSWDGASNSRLKMLRDGSTPAHLKASMEEEREDTTALKVGRASHTAILEPEEFDFSFAVADRCAAIVKSGDRKGEQCVNSGILFSATAGGWLCGTHGKGLTSDEDRIVLSSDQYDTCMRVRASVLAHESARGIMLITPRVTELSLVWIDDETGVTCKARPDCYTPSLAGGTIWDPKTTEDASEGAFERTIFDRCYHGQAAFYTDGARTLGLPVAEFVFIAVEKKRGFVATYALKEDAMNAGRTEIRSSLAVYAECVKRNVWPGYSPQIRRIGLPEWAHRKLDRVAQDAFTQSALRGAA